MANNERDSCTGNYRNINIRHLFMKDGVDRGEKEVKHCPTHLTIADY